MFLLSPRALNDCFKATHLKMTNTANIGGGGLAGDCWGGLASMLVALPSAIAFGVLVYGALGPEYAGAGALAGILGAAALGIVAPLIGGNGGIITAPCAPAAAVLSAMAVELAAHGDMSVERLLSLLALTALLAALFQLILGLLRAGRLIKFIPYQVVTGYLSGVALIIAVGQLPKLLGLPKDMSLAHGLLAPQSWNWTGIGVGLATIVAMAGASRITLKVPGAILGLAVGIATYFAASLLNPELLQLSPNLLVIGPIEVPGSLVDVVNERATSVLRVRPDDVAMVLVSALTLSVLLSVDTLKTGVVLDAMTRRRHDSNRELLAQGTANFAAFLVGGMPGAGTMGATLVNFASGGRSYRSGVIEGVLVIATFVLLGPLIAWVPIGALAGILLVVAFRMFDRRVFRLLLHRATRVDFIVIATVVAVAQIGLIAAAAVGICLAVLLFILDQVRGTVLLAKRDLRTAHSKRRRLEDERDVLKVGGAQAAVVQLQGNLFFGTTDQLVSQLEPDLTHLRYLLLDLRRVRSMDYTAAHLFEQMRQRLQERGGELLFSGMPSSLPTRPDFARYMADFGIANASRGIRVFDTRDSAIEWMEDRVLEAAGVMPQEDTRALDLGEIELLSELDDASLVELRKVARELSVPAGGRICSWGEDGNEMFLLRRGRVRVLLPLEGGKRHHLATFCQGDFFGEMAFLDRERRSADVEAATPSELYVVSRDNFDAMVKANPALGGRLFEQLALTISRRLRAADTELRFLEER
ncbi:MAG: cyclic nucleotide-binding domain-containing protein [Alphaproteobacteria bacterium]|nr:cyclic nucleotide-binding domain-containing protein [Alphaproteobacteria bacterium]